MASTEAQLANGDPPGLPTGAVTLAGVADALGVHYQTVYRWVRAHRLPAEKVGGQYLVAGLDLEAFRTARTKATGPPPPGRVRLERQAERMHDALVQGDEAAARSIARELVDHGLRVTDVIDQVIVPGLRAIGAAWHEGSLEIWVEHRASAIVGRILGDLAPNPRGRRRGQALVAAISGDRHELPTAMAAASLRDDNWHVHHLGADLPTKELLAFAQRHRVDLAVLTVTTPDVADATRDAARALSAAGTPTLVGGPGRSLEELQQGARLARRERIVDA